MASLRGNSESSPIETRVVPRSELPSTTVALAVAAATGSRHDELRPLNDVVDPDALDALANRGADGLGIEFAYEGCTVRVYGGRVRVSVDEGAGVA